MNIEYTWTRSDAEVKGGKVVSWVFGLTGKDGDASSYVDERVPVPAKDQKPKDDYTKKEVLALADGVRVVNGFDAILAKQVSAQIAAPVSESFDMGA